MRSRTRARALAAGLALVAAWGAAELGLRLAGRGERVRYPLEMELLVEHPTRIFSLEPGHRAHALHLGRYASRAEWPFRGRRPQRGLERIAVLGDSNVFGDGIDPSQTMPHRLELELAERGFHRSRFQVLNLGVQGYSSVQMATVLSEGMAGRTPPHHVVVYIAAWNDMGPAIRWSDDRLRELLAFQDTWLGRSALARLAARAGDSYVSMSFPELVTEWRAGRLPNGRRVPVDAQRAAFAEIEALCAEARATLWILGPAHPEATIRDHPATREDAARVADWARAATARSPRVGFLDVHALFRASGEGDERLFVDHVHPSPDGNALVAATLAERMAPFLPRAPAPPAPEPLALEPSRVPCFGDVELRVIGAAHRVGGPTDVTVGGAPLLELRREGADLVGLLGADAAGAHAVVLQGPGGVEVHADAVVREPPRVVLEEAGGGRRLVLISRAGDAARVVLADGLRGTPDWQRNGAFWLAPGPSFPNAARDVVCAGDGRAVIDLGAVPPSLAIVVQALVLPRGLDPTEHVEASRWTSPAP